MEFHQDINLEIYISSFYNKLNLLIRKKYIFEVKTIRIKIKNKLFRGQ